MLQMTIRDLLVAQMDESGYQLNACFEGMTAEQIDSNPVPNAFSPRECLEHLLEVCTAVQAMSEGKQHEWGTYVAPKLGALELLEHFRTERTKAVETAITSIDTNHNLASDYIVGHEFYHVGQMVTARLTLDPNWPPYSIYRH
jgi:hypothetical protein